MQYRARTMPIYTVANSCKFTIFIALMVLGFFLYITLLSAVHTAFHDRQGDFGSRHEEWKHTLTWVEKRNSLPNYFLRPKLYASSSKKWPPNEKYRNGVMVFVHNAKTGGSSMRRCIRSLRETWNKTTPTRLYSAISGNLRTFYRNMLNSSKIDYKNDMYWGDMSMGVCDYIDKPCSYFAILRNPYERAVGTYIMCRQQQGRHRAHLCQLEHANNMTVKQWSIYQESQFFDQLLVNPEILADHPKFNDLFQGELSKKKYDRFAWLKNRILLRKLVSEEQRKDILDYVIAHLKSWFSVIGLVEHYDISFRLYEHVYQLPFYVNCKPHTDKYGPEGEFGDLFKAMLKQISSDPEVKRALYYDMEIYKKAREIFALQVQAFKRERSFGD